ncbi:unnamed protein product [Pylaiella littoralis]
MASEMQQAAVVARTLAGEAAAALRARPQQSQLGIPLSKDLLWGFRRVLVKFGGKKLSQAGQKTFQALPIAYAAVSTKQAKQLKGPERGTRTTDSLVKFAIPNFLLLVKEAAHDLDLPLPLDLDEKINYTTLGTGSKSVLTFTQNPGACWTKFGTLKTEYTKGTQAQFDMGPQSEDDFESGKTSEDYMMKLLQYMWTQSNEYKTAAAQDLTGDESDGAATGAGTTVVAAATHSAAAAAATAPGRGAPEAESDGDDGVTSSRGVGSGSAAGLVTGGNAGTAGGAREVAGTRISLWHVPGPPGAGTPRPSGKICVRPAGNPRR